MNTTKVALISAPWYTVETACIQIEMLKSSLMNCSSHSISLFHMYLNVAEAIGPKLYYSLQRTSMPIHIGTAILNNHEIKKDFLCDTDNYKENEKVKLLKIIEKEGGLNTIKTKVRDCIDYYVESIDWKKYDIVGFTNSYSQLFFSTYIAKRIKKVHPNIISVFGGNECFGETAESLIEVYDQIDRVVVGAGESALLSIINEVKGRIKNPIRVHYSDNNFSSGVHPTYLDYYEQAKKQSSVWEYLEFCQVLLVEVGRGCYWNKEIPGSGLRGCTFCGEKSLWDGYQSRSADDIFNEIVFLAKNHVISTIFLIDCALSTDKIISILQNVKDENIDLEYIVGLRADLTKSDLEKLKSLGVRSITFGLESFVDSILLKMNKGVSSIQNIYAMKICEEIGVQYYSCIITHYPSLTIEEVNNSMNALQFVQYYRPLSNCRFSLLSTSPMCKQPERFGIHDIENHKYYNHYLSNFEFRNLKLYRKQFSYSVENERLWDKLEKKIHRWQKDYSKLRKNLDVPGLRYHSLGNKIRIVKRTISGSKINEQSFILYDKAAEIYRKCLSPIHFKKLCHQIGAIDKSSKVRLHHFLLELQEKKLLYSSQNKYLALAVDASQFDTTRTILF